MKHLLDNHISAQSFVFHNETFANVLDTLMHYPASHFDVRCPNTWYLKKIIEVYDEKQLYLYCKMRIKDVGNGYMVKLFN